MLRQSHIAGLLALACANAQAAPALAWVQAAQAELERRLQEAYPEVAAWRIEPLLSERQLSMSDGDGDISVEAVKLGKRSALQLAWREGDEHVRHTLWFGVAGERAGLVAIADIQRNEALLETTFRSDTRAGWDPGCDAVTSPVAVQGKRIRKALRAGDAICEEDVEPKPLVARGERVTVRARAGLVTVVLAGVAEADGNLGDWLAVRNPSSGESYMASVTAQGEVVVRR